jgi:maleylacetoacetate isomerase
MTASTFTLYHYWRSSSSWRVRWAFALKEVPWTGIAVDLLKNESESEAHLQRSPLGFVPVLQTPHGYLSESMAILDYLESVHPSPSLYPHDPWLRAKAIELTEIIVSDTQPLQNLNPQELHSSDPEKKKAWAKYWIERGLRAYETQVTATHGRFSVGDQVTVADLVLIPQLYNALRYDVSLEKFPHCARIWENCKSEPSYQKSEPAFFQPTSTT